VNNIIYLDYFYILEYYITNSSATMQIGRLLLSGILLVLVCDLHAVNILPKFTKAIGTVNPALTGFGAAMKFFDALFPPEDATLNFLKVQFRSVNSKLQRILTRLRDVENLIKYNGIVQRYTDTENHVNGLWHRLHMLSNASENAVNDQKDQFIKSFEVSYLHAAKTIYDGIMEPIPRGAMQYTKYNRREMKSIMSGFIALLKKAVLVNLAYLEMTNKTGSFDQESTVWETWKKNVQQKQESVDREVTNEWKDQRLRDLKDLSAKYHDESNEDFVDLLYDFYAYKYYWRDWFVIVYDELDTGSWWRRGESQSFSLCGGNDYLNQHGRNVLTSSVPRKKDKINTSYYNDRLRRVTETTLRGHGKAPILTSRHASDIYDDVSDFVDHNEVCMQAVIPRHKNTWRCSVRGRVAYTLKSHYQLYIFG
jgi:hypothetical protein